MARIFSLPVSYYSSVAASSITTHLDKLGLQYTNGVASLKVSSCPLCLKEGTNLYIYPASSNWSCNPCKRKGSCSELFDKLSPRTKDETKDEGNVVEAIEATATTTEATSVPEATTVSKATKIAKEATVVEPAGPHPPQVWSSVPLQTREEIKKFFNIEKIPDDVIQMYNVQLLQSEDALSPSLLFPWYSYSLSSWFNRTGAIDASNGKLIMSLATRDRLQLSQSVFGWHDFDIERSGSFAKELIITETELDAMAAYQGTSCHSIAMSLTSNSRLPPQLLEELEELDKIVIWPKRGSNLLLVSLLPKLLTKPVCFAIKYSKSFEDPLEALRKNLSFTDIINNAQSPSHKSLLSFRQLKNRVFLEFKDHDRVAGVKWKRFSGLTKILKGFRRGELTLFTGRTGSGKTTLMSEMSLDLCLQGVPTLWGSFEISNVRLIKTMMRQFSGLNFEHHLTEYHSWSEKFQSLPISFMDFHGQTDLRSVLEVMSHSVQFSGIQHIIIDNLQFMVGMKSSFDESFHSQNAVLAEFRQFATKKGVHISIIAHPRKENEDKDLTTSSFYGSVKSGQEADNVLILQSQASTDQKKFLQITKNRFSGNLGRIPLTFDVDSLTFSGTFKSQPVLSSISEKPSYNVSSKQNQSKRVPLGQPLKGLQILKSFQHQPTPLVNTEPKKTNIFDTLISPQFKRV